MPAFEGQLNSNEIFSALFNMIISQEVFADNLQKHQILVDKARVDGGLYGDQKLYYATDVLKSAPWGDDDEAANLLALHRPAAPACQAIVLDHFRQISLTVDNYLSKRAWGSEMAFSSFTSVMMGWINETKKLIDGTTYNVFMGTTVATGSKQNRTITIVSGSEGQSIAQGIANLLVEMGDYSRDFNDYGFMRSYADENIHVVWNSKFVNQIKKVDLPTIFHKDGLVDKLDQDVMPSRYFGTVITSTNLSSFSAETPTTGKPIKSADSSYVPGTNNANGTVRTTVECDVTVSGTAYHLFPGDEIPAGTILAAAQASGKLALGEVYIEDSTVICKVVVKLPPYMSAFEVGTSFFNAKSLTENHYLTWGRNTLEYLKAYPFITIKAA